MEMIEFRIQVFVFFHFGECNNILKLTANTQLRMFSVEAQDLITEMEKKCKDHSLTVPFLAPLFVCQTGLPQLADGLKSSAISKRLAGKEDRMKNIPPQPCVITSLSLMA